MPAATPPSHRRRAGTASPRLGLLVAALLVVAVSAGVAVTVQLERDDQQAAEWLEHDPTLPNPMGGRAVAAPGVANGSGSLGALEVDGTEVAMGAVPLGITVVPGWNLENSSDEEVTFTVGSPQVVEGCCPGPVYADGKEVAPGEPITVPASDRVRLEFPLQMHPGMDGPHHLQLPLGTTDGDLLLHVTGDFRADASAAT